MQYYLYLITSGDFFKFGIAQSMRNRLNAYKTHNPSLDVFALWAGGESAIKGMEKKIINLLKYRKHTNSDWIKGSPLDSEELKTFLVFYNTINRSQKIECIFISESKSDIEKNKTSYHLHMKEDEEFKHVQVRVKNSAPIHYSKRTKIDAHTSLDYYVSFDGKCAHPCKYLGSGSNHGIGETALIKIKCKIRGYNHKENHCLMYDEIGRDPKEAVRNTVTS